MDEKLPQKQTKSVNENVNPPQEALSPLADVKLKYEKYRAKLKTTPYDERVILWLDEVDLNSISEVGGKMCSLGELTKIGVPIRIAFALSTYAYRCIIKEWNVQEYLHETLQGIPKDKPSVLARIGEEIRGHLRQKEIPEKIQDSIKEAYIALGWLLNKENVVCAVRSSATAEDSPEASFAGQQDTFLYRSGGADIVNNVKECIISLFNDRAIDYRMQMDFAHAEVEISVAVQEMAISQVAGVVFTLDPESGFRNAIVINAGYGVGETVVGGEQEPDEYLVFKPTMTIIDKRIAAKKIRMIQDSVIGTKKEPVPKKDQKKQALTDAQILILAEYCASIEKHYDRPMDIEWALDDKGELVILQARPETI
ncbi:MAG: PEP/pyruvate-binding domain-containing protein, partial [Promethearchaeota archaeon]